MGIDDAVISDTILYYFVWAVCFIFFDYLVYDLLYFEEVDVGKNVICFFSSQGFGASGNYL